MPAETPAQQIPAQNVDAVVIGRNEGTRLAICLGSLGAGIRRVVYVDSGSTDGSVALATKMGAEVIALDMGRPFSAARARNAGLARLADAPPDFVQFIDGDCSLDADWLAAALDAFADHPLAVAICGRRRERHPSASIWNRMTDQEWDTPVGQARACGGDVLIRYCAVCAAGGYREDLIAGEEPELCLRLARAGGEIWRIGAEMTLHDAAMTRFGQWWRRMVRAGHAYAEGAALHGRGPERHWVHQTRRALFWGMALPALSLLGAALLHPMLLLLLLAYPLQILRLALRDRRGLRIAFFTTLSKFAETQGALGYAWTRLRGRRKVLIEYK